MAKLVYRFQEGNKEMKHLLGGKGANLAEMVGLGVRVPPGFTITTEACNAYYDHDGQLFDSLVAEVKEHLQGLEEEMGKVLGSLENPLLVSVRSGAVFSMPGMMDTVLNLGLNDQVVEVLAQQQDEKFAFDSYRRFIQMFSDVVMGVEKFHFEQVLSRIKAEKGYPEDKDIPAQELRQIVQEFKVIFLAQTGRTFPQDVEEQLFLAIEAVFRSWNNNRAKVYRRLHQISDSLGTAVNIQAMVFGNRGDESGTGVCFSRNPVDGSRELFGEYLINAQGEDVVAGIRTPKSIANLKEDKPAQYQELLGLVEELERHYQDMQDIEFTIEEGKLYLLQTRNAKRTAKAAVRVAVDLVKEGIIDKQEALLRLSAQEINQLLHPQFRPDSLAGAELLATGLAASPGAASGKIYFTAEEATKAAKQEKVILVREETSPEDIEGMVSAQAILTSRGGMTSHAAVVARGMGKSCVCGCQALQIDETTKTVRVGRHLLHEGDVLSIDGATGKVYLGALETSQDSHDEHFQELMTWADHIRPLKVYVNADNAADAKTGLGFGAEGIGLCRTEHMFFEEERIRTVRQMILAKSSEERSVYLDRLEPFQRDDFYQMFKVMEGRHLTIRLLDPPLHEFLPKEEEQIASLAADFGVNLVDLKRQLHSLAEFNPMMGHRGCRLGITYPEIYLMQARAIARAALKARKEGTPVQADIMIPLVGIDKELTYLKNLIQTCLEEEMEQAGLRFDYSIGSMIEIPRACLTADQLATQAAFFSFGTNDLTQMTYGYSRDDASKFLESYLDKQILSQDPFVSLDESGVLELMKLAIEKARSVNPEITIGICGEHGGDPVSIERCSDLGLDYVSCSPYRVLIARLAAAQSQIKKERHIWLDK